MTVIYLFKFRHIYCVQSNLQVNACQLLYHMIKLEISVIPKAIKRIEFSQSLSSLDDDLKKCCPNLIITIEDDAYRITAEFKTEKQLKAILHGKELSILAGAIRTLGEKSVINIQGLSQKKWATSFGGIHINYLKNSEIKTIM